MRTIKLCAAFIVLATLANSCFVAKNLAGANIDGESFAKAREAKIYAMRLSELEKLKAKAAKLPEYKNSDFTLYLNESLLNKIAKQYVGQKGWLDGATNYTINGVSLSLKNGCAIANMTMLAHNDKFNVDVDLVMDCLLALVTENNELLVKIEPFNISPNVSTGILLSGTGEIIENLIKLNVGKMSESLPKIAIPMAFDNPLTIAGTKMDIRENINMTILNPNRTLNYKIKIADVSFFEGKAMVALNFESAEVKQ